MVLHKVTTTSRRFRDRSEAGRLLAEQLRQYAGRDDFVVFALPRGGRPVAFEVASALNAALDLVRDPLGTVSRRSACARSVLVDVCRPLICAGSGWQCPPLSVPDNCVSGPRSRLEYDRQLPNAQRPRGMRMREHEPTGAGRRDVLNEACSVLMT